MATQGAQAQRAPPSAPLTPTVVLYNPMHAKGARLEDILDEMHNASVLILVGTGCRCRSDEERVRVWRMGVWTVYEAGWLPRESMTNKSAGVTIAARSRVFPRDRLQAHFVPAPALAGRALVLRFRAPSRDVVLFGAYFPPAAAIATTQRTTDRLASWMTGVLNSFPAKPSDVCSYVPQFYNKPWNNSEARKKNAAHEDMYNLHISATPMGRPIVEAFAQVCVDLEKATAQEGTAPPSGQERSIQDVLARMNRQS
mmetsp:Transcript_43854/g.123905  ORF Transcript_43854/g.123905 Transcript_43854/m.123905 type:complete len:255 (+) Transcript_43854:118-882(+)